MSWIYSGRRFEPRYFHLSYRPFSSLCWILCSFQFLGPSRKARKGNIGLIWLEFLSVRAFNSPLLLLVWWLFPSDISMMLNLTASVTVDNTICQTDSVNILALCYLLAFLCVYRWYLSFLLKNSIFFSIYISTQLVRLLITNAIVLYDICMTMIKIEKRHINIVDVMLVDSTSSESKDYY